MLDMEQGEHFSIFGGSAHLYSHFGKQYGSFSENWESIYFKTQLYYSLAYTQGCSILSVFVIDRNQKQLRCPSWIKKTWYIYTMEYYSAINNIFAGKWTKLEKNHPEVTQTQKYNHCVHNYRQIFAVKNNHATIHRPREAK